MGAVGAAGLGGRGSTIRVALSGSPASVIGVACSAARSAASVASSSRSAASRPAARSESFVAAARHLLRSAEAAFFRAVVLR